MKKFVIIMVSITAVCLIAAVVLTAINRGNNVWDRSPDEWETVIDGRGGEIDQTQTVSLEGMGDDCNISVQSSSDNIRLHYGDEGEVRVHFHGTIRSSRSNVPVPTLRMEETADGVSFWLDSPSIVGVLFYSRNTVMDVYLPASYEKDLDLKTSSGDIDIEGYSLHELVCEATSGQVTIRDIDADIVSADTSSGDIAATGIKGGAFIVKATSGSITGGDIATGKITLNTSSGDMRLNEVQGDIEANSTSGRIQIEEITGDGKVDAGASSGDIQMSFVDMGPELKFDTSSGSVKLWFPRDATFALKFDTSSGSFHSDFPVSMTKTERNSVEGFVGSEDNEVQIHTSSGDCKLNMR